MCVCYSITASPARTIGPMTLQIQPYQVGITLPVILSAPCIGNQAINIYGEPEASAERESIYQDKDVKVYYAWYFLDSITFCQRLFLVLLTVFLPLSDLSITKLTLVIFITLPVIYQKHWP